MTYHSEKIAVLCAAWGTSCPNEAVWEYSELTRVFASMYACDQHREPVMDLYFEVTQLDRVQVNRVPE